LTVSSQAMNSSIAIEGCAPSTCSQESTSPPSRDDGLDRLSRLAVPEDDPRPPIGCVTAVVERRERVFRRLREFDLDTEA
jgi:hypothetical protein